LAAVLAATATYYRVGLGPPLSAPKKVGGPRPTLRAGFRIVATPRPAAAPRGPVIPGLRAAQNPESSFEFAYESKTNWIPDRGCAASGMTRKGLVRAFAGAP